MGCTLSKYSEKQVIDFNKAFQYQSALSEAKEHRLRTMDVLVLDNSLRETAVAAIKGQVPADKDKIIAQLADTGISDFIVGAFGQLRRPEDVWLEEKCKDKTLDKNNWWGFSEMSDILMSGGMSGGMSGNQNLSPKDLPTSAADLPPSFGLDRCRKYGIPNIILEIDVMCNAYSLFKLRDFVELFQNRLDYIRSFSPNARLLVNLRDLPSAYFCTDPSNPAQQRLKMMIKALSMLTPKIFGIAFEDPIAELLPWQIGVMSAHVKQLMVENKWEHGELLIHVHKRFALSDAAVIEALAMGCTGIWCAVCEEGGGMGHSCSITTLVNLARLGNEKVKERYNLPALHRAAVEITKITTGSMPHPRTEVYGAQALDAVFAADGDIHLTELIDRNANIRISPFTSEEMMRQKLNDEFGEHEWEESILESMIITIHLDLEHGHSWNYNTKAGLLDLYVRSGGSNHTEAMNQKFLRCAERSHLIRDLRKKFLVVLDDAELQASVDIAESPLADFASARKLMSSMKKASFVKEDDGSNSNCEADSTTTNPNDAPSNKRDSLNALTKQKACIQVIEAATDSLSYNQFYHGFLTPYHPHQANVNPVESKVVVNTLKFLDSDGGGHIEWGELCLRAAWTLENRDEEETKSWNLRDLLNALFQNAQCNDANEIYQASIADRTLFMRENEKLINQVCSSITNDSEIEPLRKTKDARVLKIFTASLLMVHGPDTINDFGPSHTNDCDLQNLLNSARLLFHEDCVDKALQLVLDIVTVDLA